MAKHEKVQLVAEYTELLKSSKSMYLADYVGLDVGSMEELRAQCRNQSIRFQVVKNRLLRRAASDLGYEALGEHLTGPIAIAVSDLDEVSPAKVISKFAKEHKTSKPALRGAVVDGNVYGPNEAEALSKLPSLDETRSMLLNVLSAPASQLVRIIAAPGTQIARVLDARKDTLTD